MVTSELGGVRRRRGRRLNDGVTVTAVILVIHPLSYRLPPSISLGIRRLLIALRITDPPSQSSPSEEETELQDLPGNNNATTSPSSKGVSRKRMRITIGLSSAPLLAVLLLLATTSIGGEQIKLGIVGDKGVVPYDVLVLFM